jgi:hypothetical protein
VSVFVVILRVLLVFSVAGEEPEAFVEERNEISGGAQLDGVKGGATSTDDVNDDDTNAVMDNPYTTAAIPQESSYTNDSSLIQNTMLHYGEFCGPGPKLVSEGLLKAEFFL